MARRLNIRAILRKHGLRAKSRWSQNFLADLDVVNDIVAAAELEDGDAVIELGAGLGVLTAALARLARTVVAVERDRELAVMLRAEFAGDPVVEILEDNAATLDLAGLAGRLGARPVVIGNLPYHMATPILFHLVDSREHLSRAVFMLQKEMADRLVAPAGSRVYGILSVLIQRVAAVEKVFEVEPAAFHPAPRVRSAVLRFRPLPAPRVQVEDPALFERVVKGAFGQRRKMVRNSLRAAFGTELGPQGVDRALAIAGISGERRPEQLSLEDFGRLTDALGRRGREDQ